MLVLNDQLRSSMHDITQSKLSKIMWVLEQVVFFSLEYRLYDYLILTWVYMYSYSRVFEIFIHLFFYITYYIMSLLYCCTCV